MTQEMALELLVEVGRVTVKMDTIYRLDVPRIQKIEHLDKLMTPLDMQTLGRAGCLVLRCRECTAFLVADPLTINRMSSGMVPFCRVCESGTRLDGEDIRKAILGSIQKMVGETNPEVPRTQVVRRVLVPNIQSSRYRRCQNPDDQFLGNTRQVFREDGFVLGLVAAPITIMEDAVSWLSR